MRLLGAIAIASAFLTATPAWACSCVFEDIEDRDVEQAYRWADVIFEGVALRGLGITPPGDPWYGSDLALEFRVTSTIKGRMSETRTVDVQTGTSCDTGVPLGRTYRIYTSKEEGRLVTGFCYGNFDLDLARDEIVSGGRDEFQQQEGRKQLEKEAPLVAEFLSVAQPVTGPLTKEALREKAEFYEKWEDWERLEDVYKLWSEAWPEDPEGPKGLLGIYFVQNRAAEAVIPMKQLSRIDPDNDEFKKSLAQLVFMSEGILDDKFRDYSSLYLNDPVTLSGNGQRVKFDGTHFRNLNAANTNLKGSDFSNGLFEVADFAGADLTGSKFYKAKATGQISLDGGPGLEVGDVSFEGAKMTGMLLTGASFATASFKEADLNRVKAIGAILSGADFQGATLKGANFNKAQLTNANLSGVDLRKTNLFKADLRFARLQGANLSKTKTRFVDLTGAQIDCETKLPRGFDAIEVRFVLTGQSCPGLAVTKTFNDQNWEYANFDNANLKQAEFSGAEIEASSFEGADLAGAKFNRTKISDVSFNGANLEDANFKGAKLIGVIFVPEDSRVLEDSTTPASLDRTDFTGVELETYQFLGSFGPLRYAARLDAAILADVKWNCTADNPKPWKERLVPDHEHIDGLIKSLGVTEDWARAELNLRKQWIQDMENRFQAERNLVRMLRDKWPSMTFERCEKHFEGETE